MALLPLKSVSLGNSFGDFSRLVKTVFCGGKAAIKHRAAIALQGVFDAGAVLGKVADKTGGFLGDAEQIVQHQHLSVGVSAGADADNGDGKGLADLFGQLAGHAFQHQHRGTGSFKCFCIVDDALGLVIVASLYAVSTEHIHRLRRKPKVPANRNARTT